MKVTFESLQKQIEAAEKNGEPIDSYVKQQIAMLEDAHAKFLTAATAQGYQLNNPQLGAIEIQQFSAMKQLACKKRSISSQPKRPYPATVEVGCCHGSGLMVQS